MDIEKWIEGIIDLYKDCLVTYVKNGKSEEEFLADRLKMLKVMEYFRQNNLVQNFENVRDTKCEISYDVYLIQNKNQ